MYQLVKSRGMAADFTKIPERLLECRTLGIIQDSLTSFQNQAET